MIVSVHQPQYLPWLGYFHKMYNSDAFVFLDNVQYKKGEYQNRNRIRTKDGELWLTVPVLKDTGPYPNISSVRIDNAQEWQKKHWMTLGHYYAHAPFFAKYNDFFRDIYEKKWDMLIDLNMHIVQYIASSLGIDKPIYRESQLDIKTTETMRIIDICKALKADEYLSGIGGRAYLDEKKFEENGIKLHYQDFRHPEYPQRYSPFIPYMSTIDLMLNCGEDSLKILTTGYKRE